MAFSSSRNYMAHSGLRLSLLRTAELERTHSQTPIQFVRPFSDSNKYKLMKKDENLRVRVIMNLPKLMNRGIKVEFLEDDRIQQGEHGIKIHPHTYEVMKVWENQEKILWMVTELYVIAKVKLTLSTSGLLTCFYEHGAKDTWSAMAGRLKKKRDATTCVELKKVETWLDNVEGLAKDIYKVLVVHQKQKSEKKNPLEVFPDDLGSILIRLSKVRLKWREITSLEHANVLDDTGISELEEIESLVKEIHEVVVVRQLLQDYAPGGEVIWIWT